VLGPQKIYGAVEWLVASFDSPEVKEALDVYGKCWATSTAITRPCRGSGGEVPLMEGKCAFNSVGDWAPTVSLLTPG
jgi:hypothetical protein